MIPLCWVRHGGEDCRAWTSKFCPPLFSRIRMKLPTKSAQYVCAISTLERCWRPSLVARSTVFILVVFANGFNARIPARCVKSLSSSCFSRVPSLFQPILYFVHSGSNNFCISEWICASWKSTRFFASLCVNYRLNMQQVQRDQGMSYFLFCALFKKCKRPFQVFIVIILAKRVTVSISYPHTLTVASDDPLTMCASFGEKTAHWTGPSWPFIEEMTLASWR